MFKTIFSLAFQGIKRRRRQSLLIFFVLLVSFTFAIILLSYTTSVAETNSQLRLDTYGTWYGVITDGIGSDYEYLEGENWVEDVGTSVNYGTASVIVGQYPVGEITIGTADESLTDMGIRLESGQFPSSTTGIAIEAATLTELGYGATTGSSIDLEFTFSDENGYPVTIDRTFNICGVISEYTGLWSVGSTLNTAIITEEAMAEIFADAEAQLGGGVSLSTDTAYFFTIKSGAESSAESDVNKYLYSVREGTTIRTVTINPVVSMESEAAQTNMVYLVLILAITILAVVMIYILQMQAEVKRIVRFRSIGASKGQLRLLILIETLMLALPAIILGILLGLLGIRLLLSVSVYSGSVNIAVSIPWNYLLIALALWIVGIIVVRMITFQVALATPLTGRMGMQRSKSKFVTGFRKALIMLMATLLCVSAVFTTVNLAEPMSEYNYWASRWSYYIGVQDNTTMLTSDFTFPGLSDYEDDILSVEGVTDVVLFDDFFALVTTSDDEEVEQAAVIAMDWDDLEKFVDTTGVDRVAFESGESVIVQIMTDKEVYIEEFEGIDSNTGELRTFRATIDETVHDIPEEYSDITISVDYLYFEDFYTSSDYVLLREENLESEGLVSVTANVASLQLMNSDENIASLLEYDRSERFSNYALEDDSYFIICSLPLLQKIVDQIPEGTQWWIQDERFLRGQQEVGYNQAFVYTNMNAGELGVDTAVSNILSQIQYTRPGEYWLITFQYYTMTNFREINYANAQVYQQSLIMTIISGVCIALVVLMILVSTLRLETESEKRRYGILQAIGMSRRQRNMELGRRAALRSVVAIAVSIVSYLVYYLVMNIPTILAGSTAITVLGTMFATLAGYGLTAPVLLLMLVAVFMVTFLICFGTKLSLNRYSLMEMLREDR